MCRIKTVEAARILGVQRANVYELRRSGTLRAFYCDTGETIGLDDDIVNRHVEYDKADVLALKAAQPAETSIPEPPKLALCSSLPPGVADRLFFPPDFEVDADGIETPIKPDFAPAVKLCHSCPVRLECMRYAAQANITDGVCGGSVPSQLKRFAAAWRLHRELPYICRWCHRGFLVSKGWSHAWCSQKCADAGEAAGGIDSSAATPNRGI